MLRMSKLTDYGTVILAHLASDPSTCVSAAELACASGIAPPTVSKLLKSLAKAQLVHSARGVHGGYRLARTAKEISATEVIDALEGPVSITECSASDSNCAYEHHCNVGNAWQRINIAIRRALDDISLADLQRVNSPVPQFHLGGIPISIGKKA